MNNLLKYGLIAVAVIGYLIWSNNSSIDYAANDIDLNRVLDVTVDTIYAYEESSQGSEKSADDAFVEFSEQLAVNFNSTTPALHTTAIAVQPNADASLIAYVESNNNEQIDEGEEALFLIEVDGENSRVIATSRSGAVNDHRFSGSGILTGLLIGSMLSRQRASGVSSSKLANKKTVTSKQAARSRAGSGSHSRGK